MIKKLRCFWEMGGSISAENYWYGNESLLTFNAFMEALALEHDQIIDEVNDTYLERRYSACEFKFKFFLASGFDMTPKQFNKYDLRLAPDQK